MITRDMAIGEIIEQYPELVDTLTGLGVHCVGCHVSPYEPLEDGFRGHGFSEQQITTALETLNKAIQTKKQPSTHYKLTLSDFAATKIKQICQQQNKKALRVSVKAGGCSGLKYLFTLAEEPAENDLITEHQGAKVYADPNTMEKINEAMIDYKDTLSGAGFSISNPQAKATCGCGSSFN